MMEYNISNVDNINDYFMKIENISVEQVKKKSIEMLHILTQQDSKIISEICKNITLETDNEKTLHFNNLGTTDSHKFNGMFLIATKNPLHFAMDNFGSLIGDINNYNPNKEINKDESED